jgi:hypothetical protein
MRQRAGAPAPAAFNARLAALADQLHGLTFKDESMGHPAIELRRRHLDSTDAYLVRTITSVQATAPGETVSAGVVTDVPSNRQVDDVSTFRPGEQLSI